MGGKGNLSIFTYTSKFQRANGGAEQADLEVAFR